MAATKTEMALDRVALTKIGKRYGSERALHNVTLELQAGATGSVKALKMSAKLAAGRSLDPDDPALACVAAAGAAGVAGVGAMAAGAGQGGRRGTSSNRPMASRACAWHSHA